MHVNSEENQLELDRSKSILLAAIDYLLEKTAVVGRSKRIQILEEVFEIQYVED